jgi:hypothetical protein
MHLKLILFLLLFSTYIDAHAQSAETQEFIAELFEQFTSEGELEMDYTSFYDELSYFAQNPINLNQTTKEELERVPFLSDLQVEAVLTYIYQYGILRSIYELQLIDALDMTDIRRLLPFVYIGEGDKGGSKIYLVDILKYGKQEFLCRFDGGAEEKAGYSDLSEPSVTTAKEDRAIYLGSQLYNSIKYRFHYKDRIQVAFAAEKDQGEQFWGNSQRGYDFYSAAVQLADVWKFKTIVLGDFRANFGQGLVMHPEFAIGKSSYVLNVSSRGSGLKKYSSTDEANFFRGGGFSCQFGKVNLSAFCSNKSLDADTLNGTFTSWNKSGLHRTPSEFSIKHTLNQQIFGMNADLSFSSLKLGFTLVHTALNQQLQFEKSIYNHFYFSGNSQTSAGFNYRLRLIKLNMFGETAITDKGAMATLNGVTFSPSSQVSLVALQRSYSPQYDSFYATAFSESSKVNNENGIYLGAELRPYKHWRVAAAADCYRFPWPKYGLDAPSIGQYYLVQIDYNATRDLSMYWRFKSNTKQTNDLIPGTVFAMIVPTQKSSLRYSLNYSYGDFSFKNLFDVNFICEQLPSYTQGVLFSQDVSFSQKKSLFSIDIRLQFFDVPHYENRFYSYELDVLNAFSMPMIYGLGSRYYLNVRYRISNALSVWFKVAQTVYADDRLQMSSGNERIEGNRKTDLRLLIKYQL